MADTAQERVEDWPDHTFLAEFARLRVSMEMAVRREPHPQDPSAYRTFITEKDAETIARAHEYLCGLRARQREGEREPVAWRWRLKDSIMGWVYWPEEPTDIAEPNDWDIQPLYTEPPAERELVKDGGWRTERWTPEEMLGVLRSHEPGQAPYKAAREEILRRLRRAEQDFQECFAAMESYRKELDRLRARQREREEILRRLREIEEAARKAHAALQDATMLSDHDPHLPRLVYDAEVGLRRALDREGS